MCIHNTTSSCHEQKMCFKRISFEEIHRPSSDPRPDRMGEVYGIVASLNACFFFYVQDLVLASNFVKRNFTKCKKLLITGLSINRFHHNWLCINWIGGKTTKYMVNKKQTEYKAKVHVAVNCVSIKSKQLKRLKYPILFLQELDHILTLNMDVFSQSIMAIIKTFGGYKT